MNKTARLAGVQANFARGYAKVAPVSFAHRGPVDFDIWHHSTIRA